MTTTTQQALSEFLTQNVVAALLKVSPRTLEHWRLRKKGPQYANIGKHVRYRRSAVLAWFESDNG